MHKYCTLMLIISRCSKTEILPEFVTITKLGFQSLTEQQQTLNFFIQYMAWFSYGIRNLIFLLLNTRKLGRNGVKDQGSMAV